MSPACSLFSPLAGHRSLSSPVDRCSSRSPAFPLRPPIRILYRLRDPARFGLSARTTRRARVLVAASAGQADGYSAGNSVGRPVEEEEREALVELLQECGVSREESVEIVSGCPKYREMVVGNVRELDEHSLWALWGKELRGEGEGEAGGGGGGGGGDVGEVTFGKKVYLMAKKKGDKGVLPYLESIGVRYSSCVHIAGYVASMGLPELIDKVKFVKEMLFSGSGHDIRIGRNARRMMTQLSIPIDEDIQQTLSFFEKMEARRGGLDMLGIKDASFPCLVESFPRLFLCSVENKLRPLIQLLEEVGVPRESIGDVLLLFPPIFFYNIEEDIKPRISTMCKAGGENKDVGKMLVKYPWILSTSIQKNYERIHSFFEMEKVAKPSVDSAIKSWPHVLGCSMSRVKLMVAQLSDLVVTSKMLGKVIAASPQLLLRKPSEFLQVVSFMKEVGFDDESIGRILCRCPEIFASSVEKTLRKKLDFIMELGISSKHLPRVIKKYPELLVSDVDGTLLPRMRYLMKAGLSKREVSSMVYRFSPLLGYSIDVVLKPKLEFLINTMQKPVKAVVEYPRYFSYSLEKRIKPRFWVLKGRKMECSLRDMLGKNDEEFAGDYMDVGRMLILPYSAQADGSHSQG